MRVEAELILASELFTRSEKQAALIRHLLEKQLAGKDEELTEFRLAVDVFHRLPDKWYPDDSIVRVQIHELRKRLREYYEGPGKDRPGRIEIPRGVYHLRYIPRPALAAGTRRGVLLWRRVRGWGRPVLWTALAASLGVNAFILVSYLRTGRSFDPADSYSEIFGSRDRETLLCLGNPEVFSVERPKSLPPVSTKEYIRLLPPTIEKLGVIPDPKYATYLHPTTDEYTGMGEAACAFGIGRLLERRGFTPRLTQARFLSWDRALNDNLVILGHPRHASLWTRLNIATRMFSPSDAEIRFRNREYARVFDTQTSRVSMDYGIISKETTPSGVTILVLAGNTSFGTYGLGELFANPDRMGAVFRRLRATTRNHAMPHSFAVLFRIKVADDIPTDVSMVDALTDTDFNR